MFVEVMFDEEKEKHHSMCFAPVIMDKVKDAGDLLWVCKHRGKVVGHVVVHADGGWRGKHFNALVFVSHRHRNAGIGQRLVRMCLDFFTEMKQSVFLNFWVSRKNTAGLSLLVKNGFKNVSIENDLFCLQTHLFPEKKKKSS